MPTPMLLDDSSDDEVEVETSLEDQEAIMKIEEMLEANPMQIKVHLKYISLLRKCQLTQRLRSARMALRELYPLTVAMWQDWLADETSALQNKLAAASAGDEVDQDELDEDRDLTLQLFEAATSEYLSVDMWLSYLQFVMSLNTASADNAEDTVTRVRDVGEKALTAAGLHLSQASRLWDAYRAYEQALADAGWGGPGQVEKVRSLFQRQLKIPLLGMENTMAAYMQWEQTQGTSESVTAAVQRDYDAAVALMEIRMPLEEMLGAEGAGEDVLATAYKAYLKTEEATRDPSRISYMYERALASLPKKENLWIRYTNYVEEFLKTGPVVQSISQRAARNCHANGTMWARYLSAVERLGGSDTDLEEIYKTAFTYKLKTEEGYLSIILARCDSLRRQGTDGMPRLRKVVKEGMDKILKFNPEHCDPELRMAGYLAHCEMEVANDVKGARNAWEAALKASTGRLASTWQAYIAWERSHRYISEARALYRRCYTRKLENNGEIQICRDWLRFEREEGSPEDYFLARLKLEPLLEDASPALQKALTPGEVTRMRQSKDPNFKTPAQKPHQREDDEPRSKRPRADPVPDRPIVSKGSTYGSEFVAFVNHLPKFTKLVGLTKFFDCCPGLKDIRMPLDHVTGKPRGLAYIEFEGPAGLEAALELDGHHLDGVPLTIKRSDRQSGNPADSVEHVAFCRNLAWATNEHALRSFFSGCNGLKDIRVPVDHNTGRVRGIAYVEFEDRQGLEAALRLNGQFIDGRPVAIEESAPKSALAGGGRGGGRGRGFFGGRGRGDGGRGRGFYASQGGGFGGGGGRGFYGGGGYGGGGGAGFDGPMSNDQFRQQMFM